MTIYKLWHSIKYYILLFLVLLLLNGIIVRYFYSDLLNKVGEIQLFLLFLFTAWALITKVVKKNAISNYVNVLLASIGVKMGVALIYLLPVIFSDDASKEVIALNFMINYLIYLNFSVVTIVRDE